MQRLPGAHGDSLRLHIGSIRATVSLSPRFRGGSSMATLPSHSAAHPVERYLQSPFRLSAERIRGRILRVARDAGLMALVRDSAWRRNRLLVLCYHGVSQHDEHEWSPQLYVSPAHLRQRLTFLRDGGYVVLRFADAMHRLAEGTLPDRSVVLTFDDGMNDFERSALPILREFNTPVTLYLTTFYSVAQLPVFDIMLAYVLWCGRANPVPGFRLSGVSLPLHAEDDFALRRTWRAVYDAVLRDDLNAHARDQVIAIVAAAMGVDYGKITARETLQIMSPEIVRTLPHDLVDVQLHTHRHRMPLDRAAFMRELIDNDRVIRSVRGDDVILDQFCYPSGLYHEQALGWLREHGVRFATTCETDLVSPRTNPLLLPRYVDSMEKSAIGFESWVTGFASLLPRSSSAAQTELTEGDVTFRRPWKMMRATPSVRSST